MDQIKVGNFIALCRKEKNLTQMQLVLWIWQICSEFAL